MLVHIETKKSTLSTWLIAIFFMTLVVSAFISDFFRAPDSRDIQLSRYQQLFSQESLDNVQEFILKNNLGTFHLKREADQDNPWVLVSPRNLPANEDRIQGILDSLAQTKIKKVLQKDKINISNFSLDSPLVELSLVGPSKKKSTLQLGLKNSIDNTTYTILSTREAIYQINSIRAPIESFDLADFIDSRIFTLGADQVTSIKIYKGEKKRSNIQFRLTKKNGLWYGKKGLQLETQKVINYIQALNSIRPKSILDQVDEKMNKQLERYLTKPAFIVEVQDKEKRTLEYMVSGAVNKIPGLKFEKWQAFLITASNRLHPYLLNKTHFKKITISQKRLKRLSIKKLFY